MNDLAGRARLAPHEIHDLWPRLLASPLLGALVANLSGLIDHSRHSAGGLLAAYAWFAVVAFVVWEGNRRLYFRLPHREEWLLRPWRRLGVLVAVICLYTVPMAAALLWAWRQATGDSGTRPFALVTALVAVVAAAIAITHVYETVFLLRDWESDRLRSARMEQSRLEGELDRLGREVDPHFLFNNLNALLHLIEQGDDGREAAPRFIRTLSARYRYVLDCRGRPLVPLSDELESVQRHCALADIRYPKSVRVDVDVVAAETQHWLLPPVSLAELFENALKHNVVGPDCPLAIRIRLEETTLVFENDRRTRPRATGSTGIGLANLSERFRIATGRPAVWIAEQQRFVVRLPLVRHSPEITNPG